MTRRKLPIGLQTFRTLREEDYYYVDKTPYIERLVAEGTHYFLSRPRRFGKSLFLDTLKELFEGSEALFAGLDIHPRWDWSVSYPVVRLDFSGGDYQDPDGLRRNVMAQLDGIERWARVSVAGSGPERFGFLLEALHREAGRRVVVLIDEYDKPILDALGDAGTGARQPRLPAQPVRQHQVCGRARPFHLPHRRQQVLQGQPVLRPQQPQGHHPGPALLGDLRLHGSGPGRRVRVRA